VSNWLDKYGVLIAVEGYLFCLLILILIAAKITFIDGAKIDERIRAMREDTDKAPDVEIDERLKQWRP